MDPSTLSGSVWGMMTWGSAVPSQTVAMDPSGYVYIYIISYNHIHNDGWQGIWWMINGLILYHSFNPSQLITVQSKSAKRRSGMKSPLSRVRDGLRGLQKWSHGIFIWLVVYVPLWKIEKSTGMMIPRVDAYSQYMFILIYRVGWLFPHIEWDEVSWDDYSQYMGK